MTQFNEFTRWPLSRLTSFWTMFPRGDKSNEPIRSAQKGLKDGHKNTASFQPRPLKVCETGAPDAFIVSKFQKQAIVMKTLILNFFRSESGATAIEYALIASFVAMVCVAAMKLVGTNLNKKFLSVSAGLN